MKHEFTTLLTLGLLFFGADSAYCQSTKEAEEAELKGEAARKVGDLESAIAHFNEAIRLDPKYAKAYSFRGLTYGDLRKLDAGLADCNAAIRLDPKSAIAYVNRGEVYFSKSEFNKAITDHSEAIRVDPKCVEAYVDRASVYGIKNECDKQIADAREAYRLNPKLPLANNSLGCAYDNCARSIARANDRTAELLFDRISSCFDGPPEQLQDVQPQLAFDGSIEHFRATAKKLDRMLKVQLLFDYSASYFHTAIELRPDYDFANNNLGVYYARAGSRHDAARAEKYFRAAVKINPRCADAYNNLGIVLAEQGKLDEAISAHKAGLAIRGGRASDHNNLSRVYLQKGDFENAIEANGNALKCDRKFLPAWASRAEIYERQKDLDEVTKCVEAMISLDAKSPDTVYAQRTLVGKYLELNRANDALALLDKSISANSSSPELYAYRAEAYLRKGDLIRAMQDYQQVKRLRPRLSAVQERIDAIQAQLDKSAKGTGQAKGDSND